jgi:hypothetical protein
MEVETKKRRRGELEHLPASQLEATLGSTILSRGSAELALDYLIDRYNFDLDALKAKLVGRQFESAWHLFNGFPS